MSRVTQNRAHEGGWRVDRANATNLLAMLVLRQHGKPAVPGSYVDLDGPETEEFGRLFSRTTQKDCRSCRSDAFRRPVFLEAEAAGGNERLFIYIAVRNIDRLR
jgi:hypothetical protein